MSEIYINKTVYRQKPDDNREKKEMAVYELLDKLNISYLRLDHEQTASMTDCEEVGKILGIEICKNLFLCNRQKTNFYLLMLPGTKEFHTKDLSKQINSARLSFADEEYMQKFLNITPGSVSVMGLMNDSENNVQLIIDGDVLKNSYFGCHPCVNTSSLKISTKDLIEKFLPSVHHDKIIVNL